MTTAEIINSNEHELATKLYLELYGSPKSHREWAESFTKIGKIRTTLLQWKQPN